MKNNIKMRAHLIFMFRESNDNLLTFEKQNSNLTFFTYFSFCILITMEINNKKKN